MPPFVLITGVKKIDKRLKQLPPKVQKKVVRQAIRKALKVVQKEVQSQVPIDTGLTKRNVKVRAVKKRRRDTISIDVRVQGNESLINKTAEGKPVFYPAVVEYGREGVAPNPFMRRAFEAKGAEARAMAMQDILDGIEREATT